MRVSRARPIERDIRRVGFAWCAYAPLESTYPVRSTSHTELARIYYLLLHDTFHDSARTCCSPLPLSGSY